MLPVSFWGHFGVFHMRYTFKLTETDKKGERKGRERAETQTESQLQGNKQREREREREREGEKPIERKKPRQSARQCLGRRQTAIKRKTEEEARKEGKK